MLRHSVPEEPEPVAVVASRLRAERQAVATLCPRPSALGPQPVTATPSLGCWLDQTGVNSVLINSGFHMDSP